MDIHIQIGLKIKQLRKNLGLTQDDLANGIVSRSFISQLEKGRVSPSLDTLEKISNRLGCSIGSLLDQKVTLENSSTDFESIINRVEKHIEEINFEEAYKYEETLSAISINHLNDELKGKYFYIQGVFFWNRKEYLDSKVYALKAVEHLKQYKEEELIKVYNLLGKVNFHLNEIHESMTCFFKALYLSQKYSQFVYFKIETLFNLGVLHAHIKEYTSAIYYLTEAEKVNINTETLYKIGETYMTLGVCYKNTSNFPKAIDYYQRSLAYFDLLNNKHLFAGVYVNLGYLFRKKHEYQISNDYFHKALDIYYTLQENCLAVDIEIEVAKNYIHQKDIDSLLKQIYTIKLQELNLKQEALLNFFNGYVSLYNNKVDKSLGYFNKCKEYLEENKNTDMLHQTSFEIAILLADNDLFKEATLYFKNAEVQY
jgi:HTH-type transcriptional regulator, quorum sensing regulator NprR